MILNNALEEDLRRLGGMLRGRPLVGLSDRLFPIGTHVEADLEAVAPKVLQKCKGTAFTTAALKQVSDDVTEIETIVFGHVDERFCTYRAQHPDSPYFSSITLFGPIDLGRLETAATRAIAWLIDENQPHGFGCDIAQILLSRLGTGSAPRNVAKVHAAIPEYHAGRASSTGRMQRIDIWATGTWDDGSLWNLMVEAKIDAGESENQLAEYEAEATASTECVFLTPDGREATSASQRHWAALSFQVLAEDLAAYYLQSSHKPGAPFLRLFVAGLLREVLRRPVPISTTAGNRFDIMSMINLSTLRIPV